MQPGNQFRKYIESIDADWYRTRFIVLVAGVLCAFLILGARLTYLQIIKGPYYYELSKDNCIRKKRIKPFRGLIYDRTGRLLVENRPSFNLQIIRKDAEPVEETVRKLSRHILLKPREIHEKLKTSGGGAYDPVLIQEDIDRSTMASVAAHRFELPGVSIEARARRHYIYPSLAAHLLGYLGEVNAGEIRSKKFKSLQKGDYVGRFGVEKAMEDYLCGRAGGQVVQVNAAGQVAEILDEVAPEAGNNLFLTIDFQLQKLAESLLEEKAGAVVAMDPTNGEILAMASKPGFNQNQFVEGMTAAQWQELLKNPDRPMMNKAIQGEYPPASTYKIVTALAALEEGAATTEEQTYCPGHYRYGNRLYYCWKKYGHGKVNLVEALSQSCDVFFYRMGQRLGVDVLAEYARGCGLGAPTGIALDREAEGLVPTADWKLRRFGVPWQGGESLSVAIGQGYNLVTPLQMAVLVSAVANGGTRYQPRILKTVETVEGKTIKRMEPAVDGRIPVAPETLAIVKRGLWRAVNSRHGTAYWHVRDKDIEISGKTGTAQIISRKAGEKRQEKTADQYKPHAWFIGYAPSEHPRIAVSVLVEHGEHGSSGAGPIAGSLMKAYLDRPAPETRAAEKNAPGTHEE
jgi:penicillin-binding protein 2